jgi:glycosyltransferase involved in cell wall biosynthesis
VARRGLSSGSLHTFARCLHCCGRVNHRPVVLRQRPGDKVVVAEDERRAAMSARGTVLFPVEWMPDYRVEFFERLRGALDEQGVRLRVVYGNPTPEEEQRRASGRLDWGIRRDNLVLPIGSRSLVWQPCARDALDSELVIVDQASRLLLNYWLLWQQTRSRCRVAFWGHGENLNHEKASRLGERVKLRAARMPHWWFAYTEGTRKRVALLGYPPARITVTQNAGETALLRRLLKTVTPAGEGQLRRDLGLSDGPIGLFLGSLYPDKRLDYLIAAADELASRRPDFRLVIAGEGPARDVVAAAASSRPHVLWVGRVEGERKAALLKNASVLMLPGAAGLAVVDAFTAGLPVVTTSATTHGPEVEYVRDGENGRIVPSSLGPAQYAEAVLSTLENSRRLRRGAARTGERCTTTGMVSRFVGGILEALDAEPQRGRR